MAFNLNTNISAFTVFFQGILSFLSPCVLPLLPVYLGFLAGSGKKTDAQGEVSYQRGKTFLNTLFFALGISSTFFILGFGFTALGTALKEHRTTLAIVGAVFMILFGLYQLGVFKHIMGIERERRLPFEMHTLASNPITAFLLGFTFSFGWTPCIGPAMTSVFLMASSAENAAKAALLIGVYALGFILPFLITGLFTGEILNFFRKRMYILQYTAKLGGILLIIMGILTFTTSAKAAFFFPKKPANVQTQSNIETNSISEHYVQI